VQNDVGGVAIIEATIPPARLILSIDFACFTVNSDLLLEFVYLFLAFFDVADFTPNRRNIVASGGAFFLQIGVGINAGFFNIYESFRIAFQVFYLRLLLESFPVTLA